MRRLLVLVLLVSALGCGGDDSAPNNDAIVRVEKPVGPAGGELALSDGAKIEIPAGALDSTVMLTLREVERPKDLPNNLEQAGKPYAFEPHGTVFQRPVKLSLPYEVARDDMNDVRPVKLDDEDDDQWNTVVGSDKADGKLSFEVRSFSFYQVARPRRNTGVITLPDGATLPADAALPTIDASDDAATDAGADATVADTGVDAGNDASVDAHVDAGTMGIFVDPNLEAAVRAELNIQTAELTDADLQMVNTLYPSAVITSLVGLERCINLQTFHVSGTFTSAAPLRNLAMLTDLVIDGAPVALADIGMITSLRELRIRFGFSTGNLSELSGLTNLTRLELFRTAAAGSIASLSGMTQLDILYINESPMVGGTLADVAAIPALRYVNLGGTNVGGDLSALQNATRFLGIQLGDTPVTGDLSSLTLLNLQSFGAPAAVTGQLSVLGSMTSITGIDVHGNHNIVGTLSDLSNRSSLDYVDVSDSEIGGNLSGITNSQNVMAYFYAGDSNVTGDIGELYYMLFLQELDLHGLAGVTGDITGGVINMLQLTNLSLEGTSVSGNISVLSDKNQLNYLYLSDTNVSGDLSALLPMDALVFAYLRSTMVSGDFSALVSALPELPAQLYLQGVPIDCTAQASNLDALLMSGAQIECDCF